MTRNRLTFLALSTALAACAPTVRAVDADGDGVNSLNDCDDHNAGRSPLIEEVPYDGIDQDCDGTDLIDVDHDGWLAMEVGGTDCDDFDASIHPKLADIAYDGIDQDCDGSDLIDIDGDGFFGGDRGTDCDDNNPLIHPGGVDTCGDGLDQDCSGSDAACTETDADGDGFPASEGDCNDFDDTVFPGAEEVPYDGIDQDCDIATPDDDLDGDGFNQMGGGDCDDSDRLIFPGADETPYDGIDQDCSGSDFSDLDYDGYEGGETGADCDDRDPRVNPGATEIPFDENDANCDENDDLDQGSFVVSEGVGSRFAQAALAGGTEGYLMVGRDWYDSGSGWQSHIIAALVGPDGSQQGTPFGIDETSAYAQAPEVAAGADGYLVVWQQDYSIEGIYVGADGALESSFTIADNSGGGYHRNPSVVGTDAGFVVLWDYEPPTTWQSSVFAVAVDGSTVGTAFEVARLDSGYTQDGTGAASEEGVLLTVVEDNDMDGKPVLGRLLDLDLNPVGDSFVVWSGDGRADEPTVAPSADGTGFLVGFEVEDPGYGGSDIYVQTVASNGEISGTAQAVTESSLGGDDYRKDPNLLAVGNAYWLTWTDTRFALPGGDDASGIYGRWIYSPGPTDPAYELGEEVALRYTSDESVDPVTAAAAGRVLTVWSTDDDGSGAEARGYSVPTGGN